VSAATTMVKIACFGISINVSLSRSRASTVIDHLKSSFSGLPPT
jgi:hypothetical protein